MIVNITGGEHTGKFGTLLDEEGDICTVKLTQIFPNPNATIIKINKSDVKFMPEVFGATAPTNSWR